MDEHLNFTSCSKTLADSGGRALSAIISRFKSFKDIGYTTFTKLYDTCVTPVTDYGSSIWGKHNVKHADMIQNRACRYFLGVHNFTPIPSLQAEMGWLPPKYRKCINMLRFWNRLMNMANDRLTKRTFIMDYNRGVSNWCERIKSVFEMLDLLPVYENKEICDIVFCTERMFEIFNKECQEDIRKKPKLRTYKLFKKDCNVAEYIKSCLNKSERSLLAKFRCGILQLRIETGRFDQTKVEDRICELCDDDLIEDEFHFLMKCRLYDDLRDVLFAKAKLKCENFCNMTGEEKFVYLMSNCNFNVAKFIKNAWQLRKEKRYNVN